MTRLWPLACLIVLHTPDGGELRIDTRHIVAVRPADAVKQHLAPGAKTIIYVSGQNFAVIEMVEEVQEIVEECVGEGR